MPLHSKRCLQGYNRQKQYKRVPKHKAVKLWLLTTQYESVWPSFSLWLEMCGGSVCGECCRKGSRKEKECKGLLHLRSLDVLICFSNKAALWGRVQLIWSTHTVKGMSAELFCSDFGIMTNFSSPPHHFLHSSTHFSLPFCRITNTHLWARSHFLISVNFQRENRLFSVWSISQCLVNGKLLIRWGCASPLCWKKCAQPGSNWPGRC